MGYYVNQRYVNNFGSQFDLYGAVTLRQIFTTKSVGGKIKKKKGAKKGRLRDFYTANTNADVASIIYLEYLYMATQDAIDGDIIRLSATKDFPVMQVGFLQETESDDLIAKNIIPKDLNLRDFDYRLPRVVINYGPMSKITDRVIKVPKKLYTKMLDNLKSGKRYAKVVSLVKKML